jgi:hypothetical protein
MMLVRSRTSFQQRVSEPTLPARPLASAHRETPCRRRHGAENQGTSRRGWYGGAARRGRNSAREEARFHIETTFIACASRADGSGRRDRPPQPREPVRSGTAGRSAQCRGADTLTLVQGGGAAFVFGTMHPAIEQSAAPPSAAAASASSGMATACGNLPRPARSFHRSSTRWPRARGRREDRLPDPCHGIRASGIDREAGPPQTRSNGR